MRSVSADFVLAMEEKLQHGREKGRTGWDTHWEKTSVDGFVIGDLLEKLDEELIELRYEAWALNPFSSKPVNLKSLRLEAADVANVAMMIADMAGALNDE